MYLMMPTPEENHHSEGHFDFELEYGSNYGWHDQHSPEEFNPFESHFYK